MDKPITDYRPETRDYRQLIVCGLQSVVCSLAILALCPIAVYAATATANTTEKSTSATKTAAVQQAAATVVKASSKVSQALVGKQGTRTLPSGETVSLLTDANVGDVEDNAVAVQEDAVTTNVTFEPIGKTVAGQSQETASVTAPDRTSAGSSQGTKGLDASPKKYVFQYPDPPVLSDEMQSVKKTLTGEVGLVIKTGMNVEFDRKASSSSDFWVEFTKGVKLEGVKTLGEFLPGDKVQVSYEEAKDHSKRAVRSIKLLKRKTEEEKKREAAADARAEAVAAKRSTLAEES